MKIVKNIFMLVTAFLFSANLTFAQEKKLEKHSGTSGETYILERQMTDTSDEKLQKIATGARDLVDEIGPQVEWVHSYVTDDKMICVFKYESREALAEHAHRAGLKITDLKKVESMIGPETAENR